MGSTLALSTRIGVAILVSLALLTAGVTAFVVTNSKIGLSQLTGPADVGPGPSNPPTDDK